MERQRTSFFSMFNMSFGFLGIQFGWGLQLANMSAIYEKLGATPEQVPILWLAAPMTGLLVQPIVGALSDNTWTPLGRRRPYFLVGAIFSSIALFFMPMSTALWMAAALLWILDASINTSMEPFRAFVADKLDRDQRTAGFVMQSFFIGLGASLANALPLLLRMMGVEGATDSGIPLTVKYSFQIGAFVFLAAILWTIFTTSEKPPADMDAFLRAKAERAARGRWMVAIFTDIGSAVRAMPRTMKQLAVVQIFTWLGLFSMWMFFVPATARHVFGATDPQSELYTRGMEWGGFAFAFYSITCFAVAFALPPLARATSRKTVHAIALTLGGIGLLSVYLIHDPYVLLLTMVGVGIAWASILSMPYAILSNAIPDARMGVYMGVFNAFIVIPEIAAAIGFGPLIRLFFGEGNPNAPVYVVMVGGVCLLLAALSVYFVDDLAPDARPSLKEMLPGPEVQAAP
ncbi:MAG: MFS transporter [Gemmatimonadetes bacterium]|nr:MFS transporter [Gemmatimonadota bacterium]